MLVFLSLVNNVKSCLVRIFACWNRAAGNLLPFYYRHKGIFTLELQLATPLMSSQQSARVQTLTYFLVNKHFEDVIENHRSWKLWDLECEILDIKADLWSYEAVHAQAKNF